MAARPPVIGEQIDAEMVIRTATINLSTERFDDMRSSVERLVSRHEGRIAQFTTTGQRPASRSIHAVIRVPSAKLDAFMSELRQLGRVQHESLASEEVTNSYRDLTIRIGNAKREEQRLVDLLSRRTGNLADVLAVERELARVRTDIERMEAEERTMKGRVDLATVTVAIEEQYKADLAIGPLPIRVRIANAFVDGINGAIRNLVAVVLAILEIAPTLLLCALILLWPARALWKKRSGA